MREEGAGQGGGGGVEVEALYTGNQTQPIT